MAGEDNFRSPREQSFANDPHHLPGLARVAPTAVEDVLVLKTEVTGEGNAFSSQRRRIDGQIETVPGNKLGMEVETGPLNPVSSPTRANGSDTSNGRGGYMP